MGLGNRYGQTCSDKDAIEVANKYLGTSYDTVKAVYDHLDKIKIVAELGELNRGLQGNVPNVTDNGDGSYTIHGHNGNVTISDGFSPKVEPNPWMTGVTVEDAQGTITSINNGLIVKSVFIYHNSDAVPDTPSNVLYDGDTYTLPTGWSLFPLATNDDELTWVSTTEVKQQVDNTWIIGDWSEPVRFTGKDGYLPVKGEDYTDGTDGAYISYVYQKLGVRPVSPDGGSYSGNIGSEVLPTGWFDNPPEHSAGELVWVAIRRYVHDGTNWIGGAWSVPRLFSGKEGYTPKKGVDFTDGLTGDYHSYAYKNSVAVPLTPPDGSYDGTTEVMPIGWSDDPVTPNAGESTWVTHTIYKNVADGVWNRQAWSYPARHSGRTPVRGIDYTDGSDGSYTSFIFRNAINKPSIPNGGSWDGTNEVIPTSWTDDPSAPGADEITWMSKRKYIHDGISYSPQTAWSSPVNWSGQNGYTPQFGVDYFNGSAGRFTSYVFRMGATAPPTPIGGTFDGTNEIVPTGWYDDPSIPVGTDVIWVSKTEYSIDNAGNWVNNGWSEPVQFTGKDGSAKFVSQIFITTDTVPARPTGGSYDGTTETFPTGWDNEPVEPNETQNIYTSFATYTKDDTTGDWSHTGWSLPIIFSQGVDTGILETEIGDIRGDVDAMLEDIIWNTVHNHLTETDTGFNEAGVYEAKEAITTESAARVLQGTQLQASIDTVNGTLNGEITRVDGIELDIQGNLQAISALQAAVNDSVRGLDASYLLAQQAKITADGNVISITDIGGKVNDANRGIDATYNIASAAQVASNGNAMAILNLEGKVNDTNTGLEATYSIASAAQTQSDGNAQSITALQNTIGDASSGLILDVTNNTDKVDSLSARAYLGVNVNNRITGIHINGSNSASSIQFQAENIAFVDTSGAGHLVWDNSSNTLSFSGHLNAASGTFAGRVDIQNADGFAAVNAVKTGGGNAIVASHSGNGTAISAQSNGNAIICGSTGSGHGLVADKILADRYDVRGTTFQLKNSSNSSNLVNAVLDIIQRLEALESP